MKINRLQDMERYVARQGTASMEELADRYGVSMNTIRRDVAELVRRGLAEKVYGGVSAHHTEQNLTPYEIRKLSAESAKRAIAQKAAELVHDGDVIFLDSGTTTLHLVDQLSHLRSLTIVTNNLEAIFRALPYEQITLIALPGLVRRKTNSMTGFDAVESLKHYNIRLAFMAATGLSLHGATNSSDKEYEIKKTAVQISEQVALLVNKEKFGVTGLTTFANLTDFDYIVSDGSPDAELESRLLDAGARLLVAE